MNCENATLTFYTPDNHTSTYSRHKVPAHRKPQSMAWFPDCTRTLER